MLGWKIFVHSLRMVFGNFSQVLKITIGPALIATFSVVALFLVFGVPIQSSNANTEAISANPSVVAVFLSVFVFFIVMLWIAVSWHRFILLEEYPTRLLPPFRFDRILAYFGRALLLCLLAAVLLLPVTGVLGGLMQSVPALGMLLAFVFLSLVAVCIYRLSIILPAAAIGQRISLGEAWAATRGAAWSFIGLLVVTILFQFVIQLVFTVLAFIPVLGSLLVLFVSFLILPMINVSILTTLYGVFIEKRELG